MLHKMICILLVVCFFCTFFSCNQFTHLKTQQRIVYPTIPIVKAYPVGVRQRVQQLLQAHVYRLGKSTVIHQVDSIVRLQVNQQYFIVVYYQSTQGHSNWVFRAIGNPLAANMELQYVHGESGRVLDYSYPFGVGYMPIRIPYVMQPSSGRYTAASSIHCSGGACECLVKVIYNKDVSIGCSCSSCSLVIHAFPQSDFELLMDAL